MSHKRKRMNLLYWKQLAAIAVVSSGVLGSSPGWASITGEMLVGYGLSYDDNINGSTSDGVEDIANEAYFDVTLSKPDGFFRYDVLGRTAFQAHSSSTVIDSLSVSGGLNALWLLLPNRLSWTLSDVATIRRLDTRDISSAANTEQTNIFRTGPSLNFQPSGRTYLDLNAYYQQSYAEFGDTDEYLGAEVSGTYRMTELTRFVASVSEIHYLPENSIFSDQTSRSTSARMTRRLQRGSWYIGGGVSQIEVDGISVSEDDALEPIYMAGFDYQLAPRLGFSISASQQIYTAGEGALDDIDTSSLVEGLNQAIFVLPPSISESFSFLRDEIEEFRYPTGFTLSQSLSSSLSWSDGQWGAAMTIYGSRLNVPDFQIGLSAGARALLFPDRAIDTDQSSLGVELSVRVEPVVRWNVFGVLRMANRNIDSVNLLDATGSIQESRLRETTASVGATFAATRYLSFGGDIQSALLSDRDGVDGDIRSNRIGFNVEYSL